MACIEAMYATPTANVCGGGSGMGGKSRGLRAGAIHYHLKMAAKGFTKLHTLFSAGTYGDLQDRHFGPFIEEWGEWGVIKQMHGIHGKCFLFNNPQLGAIQFRNVGEEGGRRGSEAYAGFFDELTQVSREVFGSWSYRCRKPGIPFNPILSMTNPDGIGFQFVKSAWRPDWSDREAAQSTKYSQDFDPDGSLDPKDHIFIGFLPTDNPVYDEKQFSRAVAHLPPHIQRARRLGLWNAPEGARWPFLKPEDHIFRMRERFPHGIPDWYTRLLGVDYGVRAPYAALWMAVDGEGDVFLYREDYVSGFTADLQAIRIQEKTLENERIDEAILDNQFWQETARIDSKQKPKRLVEDYEEVLCKDPRFPNALTPGAKPLRTVSLAALDKYLNRNNEFANLWIEESCRHTWSELTGAVFDSRNPTSEDIDPKCPDHAITAAYYALKTHFDTPRAPRLSGRVSSEEIAAERVRNLEAARTKSMRNLARDINRASRRTF
jgi:hypothetical protein